MIMWFFLTSLDQGFGPGASLPLPLHTLEVSCLLVLLYDLVDGASAQSFGDY